MRFRQINNQQDLFGQLKHSKLLAESTTPLYKLAKIIDFEVFRESLMEALGYIDKEDKGGNTPFDPVFMFKIVVLQKYYNLSEEQTEFQIKDRFSFMRFLCISPGDEVPDKNTIWHFKEKLGSAGVVSLFDRLDELLVAQGIVGKEGVSVDASFVDVPRQRNTKEENESIKNGELPEGWEDESVRKLCQKDLDARWTKKNQQTHYGYKNHVTMDNATKLIRSWLSSPANEHDSQCFETIINYGDKEVFADSAYRSKESMKLLRKLKVKAQISQKGTRTQKLTKRQEAANRIKSRTRCRVEHVFGDQSHYGADTIRTIGMFRAARGIGLGNLVYNLRRLCSMGIPLT